MSTTFAPFGRRPPWCDAILDQVLPYLTLGQPYACTRDPNAFSGDVRDRALAFGKLVLVLEVHGRSVAQALYTVSGDPEAVQYDLDALHLDWHGLGRLPVSWRGLPRLDLGTDAPP